MIPFTYSQMLLALGAAFLFVLGVFLLRSRWLSHAAGLQNLMDQGGIRQNEIYQDYLIPLMLYEEKYPSFGKILSLVLSHFPLSRFLSREGFKSALSFLRDGAFQPADVNRTVVAMSVIVRCLLEDPDVEYRCRKPLPALVNEFLKEIETS